MASKAINAGEIASIRLNEPFSVCFAIYFLLLGVTPSDQDMVGERIMEIEEDDLVRLTERHTAPDLHSTLYWDILK